MFYEKITALNQTIIECLNETDENKIIRIFTESGIALLEADFGFVWMGKKDENAFTLAYRSVNLPYTPLPPKKGGRNTKVFESALPDFVRTVEKRKDAYDVSKYMKSFVIVPISYRDKIYGNIVFCFAKTENFPKEKRILCECIGTNVAQVITIHRLLIREQEKSQAEFIAEATHELRTPLAIIRGNVDLALRSGTKNPSEIARTLRAVNDEVGHMSELVSDLSLLVKSEGSFRRKLASHDVRLDRLVSRTVQRCKSLAHEKGVTLKLRKMPPVSISGDGPYLEKLFTNLIKNAIFYGKKNGTVAIAGKKKDGAISIDVSDNGIGISEKDMSHLFERFYRSDRARVENREGTGLGLAIVKWIAEAHGGSVEATSAEKKGSTFRVSFPLKK